jgi:UDP-glucose 4-epimerase
MSETILVTGGCGYIGSHTVVELLQKGFKVIIIDNLCNSSSRVLQQIKQIVGEEVYSRLQYYEIDVLQVETIFLLYSIHAVIHFAALKAVGESVKQPLMYYENNITRTITLLQVMKKYNCSRFVFSSSATVYGNPEHIPVTESSTLRVTNPYGRTKLMIEEILQDVCASDPSWNVCILRYFNPIGAHRSGLIGENPLGLPNNIMPYIQQVAVGRLPQLTIFGKDYDTVDGTGVRDYIHVVDLALGHLSALQYVSDDTHMGCNVFNLGTGKGYSVMELILMFETISEQQISYQIGERRQGDIACVYADTSKAENELGWKAIHTLEDMCRDAWRWQKMYPNGL